MLTHVLIAAGLAPGIAVSTSSIDIVPPQPFTLGGYTARLGKLAEPGGDPLKARTMVFRGGGTTIALVSAELLTIPESLRREVESRIPGNVELFLAATHTHCAPDSQALNERMTLAVPGIAKFKQEQLDWMADRIAEGIDRALSGSGIQVETFGMKVGHVEANRRRRPLAAPSKLAQVISLKLSHDAMGTQYLPAIVHYAAHATFYGPERMQTSGDWPGNVEAARAGFMVLQGAIGDVSPAAEGPTPEARISRFWSTFAEELDRKQASDVSADRLSFASSAIALPAVVAHPDFAKNNKVPEAIAQGFVKQFAPTEASIVGIRLGKIAILGVPGEPTSALGKRIRDEGQRQGFTYVLVCSHVNGWLGYILEAEDYRRGGYEASLAMHGPGLANAVLSAAKQTFQKLKR
jgi:neutral ceramidase